MGLMILAILNLFCGLILDTVVRGRLETRRLAYLSLPPPQLATVPLGKADDFDQRQSMASQNRLRVAEA
jgi:hypothetical protein